MRSYEIISESNTSLRIGDVVANASHAVNAAQQLNAKVVKTVAGYYKIAPLDDPRPAVTTNTDYYDTQRKLRKDIEQIKQQIRSVDSEFNRERSGIFNKMDQLFPNSNVHDQARVNWLDRGLWKLNQKYYQTIEYKNLIAALRDKQQDLKQLVDSNKRSISNPVA